jgi:hypothetical protein
MEEGGFPLIRLGALEHDGFKRNHPYALTYWWSMIFSEKWFAFFRIMR